MSERWPDPHDRLIYYIEKRRGADKPETIRRWYLALTRNLDEASPHPRAAEALQTVIQLAPAVLRVKRVAITRVDMKAIGLPDRERQQRIRDAGEVPIVVVGDLDGDEKLTIVDGKQRVWAVHLANLGARGEGATIAAVSIRGNKRPWWERRNFPGPRGNHRPLYAPPGDVDEL